MECPSLTIYIAKEYKHTMQLNEKKRNDNFVLFSFEIEFVYSEIKFWCAHNTIKKQRRFAAMEYGVCMLVERIHFDAYSFFSLLKNQLEILHLFIQTEKKE